MADGSRQSKLAAAKKKLKEYQQKNSPVSTVGPKKKRRGKEESHLDTPNQSGRESPENIENILKVLVSDLNRSNGVAIPSLDTWKANCDGEVATPKADLLTDSVPLPSNSNSYSCLAAPSPGSMPPSQIHDSGHKNALEENRSLSLTEKLRQLSEQLNGMVSQPAAYMNGESVTPSTDMKEMVTRYQELAIALDSSNLTNKQLSAKIEELKLQNQEAANQLETEKKSFEQKFVKEQGALREQLQVHIQTIGILVSEKSELQTALAHTQQAARQKAGEAEELTARLQSSRQRISEVEQTLSSLSTQQKQAEKLNRELTKERDNLKLESYKQSKASEELKQQISELSEKLRSLISENSALKLDLEDLHKKLEMAELMIQQFSSQPGISEATQQLQVILEEKVHWEAQIAQMSASLQQLQAERDQYVLRLKEEGSVWQQRLELLSGQVQALTEEKELSATRIQELETNLSELLSSQSVNAPESQPAPVAGPSETELGLQRELVQLQKEKEELLGQSQAQGRDNEQLSRLNREQEERLQEMEKALQRYSEEAVDRQQILENMQSDKATISRALTQNRELKEQLAELQNGFVKLTNENMEVTNALQTEQHVKKELAKKLGELQEKLGDVKETVMQKTQEAQALQEQRDQYFSHLQQYTTAYQQLALEKEELHKQHLLQMQLMDRLQHEEVQGKVTAEVHFKELQQAKESLELFSRENKELQAQVSQLMAELDEQMLPRAQGDGVEAEEMVEDPKASQLTIPEDFESKEEMVAFLTSAVSQAEAERKEMRQELAEKRRQCKGLLQQIATLRKEQQQQQLLPGGGSAADSVPGEVHEALRSAMEKLQFRFTDLMREKVELRERVEELEHRCIQLSGETDTIGEYIALYQSQRAILKQRHREKEEYISRLAQDKEEMKMKLLELQELVMRLVGERNDWYAKYVTATQAGQPAARSERKQPPEPDASETEAGLPDLREVSLTDEPEREASASPSHLPPSEGRGLQPAPQDPTAKQILQLLHEIQNPRDRLGSLLENPCIPFFYRVDENDEVKIMVV